jgi:hypothetical protein
MGKKWKLFKRRKQMKGNKLRTESGGMVKQRVKPKGGTMKRILIGFVLVMAGIGSAHALTTDSVILTVTPIFNLSVNISSATNDFGQVVLKSSKTICVGRIANDGNVTAAWQKKSTNTSSVSPSWSLMTSGSMGKDQFRLLAVTTGTAATPTFSGTMGNSCVEGDPEGSISVTTAYSELTEGSATALSPIHQLGETRDLWVSIMMPDNVSGSEQQTITLSVLAVNR